LVVEEALIWAIKSANDKHEKNGTGLSYSGANGQWSFPY
jgi:hypothetical protein